MTEALGLGDIELNGRKYRIDIETWKEKDIIDFAPRATVPTGSVVMSDLNLYQPLVQTDWRHGQGFHWFDDAAGYLQTIGSVDTRQDGLVMLMTKPTASDNDNAIKRGMVSFNGDMYSYGDSGVRKYSAGAWTQVNTRHSSLGSTYKNSSASASSLNVTGIVIQNAANRVAFAIVHLTTNATVSAITLGGVSMGAAVESQGTGPKIILYKLVNPTPGTVTLSATLSGAAGVAIEVVLFYGVSQTTPADNVLSASDTATTSVVYASYTSAAQHVIMMAVSINAASSISANNGATLNESGTITGLGYATVYKAGSASTDVGLQWSGSQNAASVIFDVVYEDTEPVCNFLLNAGDYLFMCPDGERLQKMNKSGVISNAGLDHNSIDFKWLIIHNGFIFGGIDGTNQIHYDTNTDLSQMEGTTADPDIIYCGIGNKPTIAAIVFAAALYVTREDGLWNIDDSHIARRVIDYSNEADSTNFRGLAIINGYLVFALRDRVIQWNGARVSDITPMRITDIYPYVTYGRFDNFVVANNFLYVTGRTNETPYREDLLCYDGVGWHKLADVLTSDTATSMTMIAYDIVNNYLWYHVDAAADETYYIPFQDQSSFPYADFPTGGGHVLVTSRLDMGFRRVKKSMASLIVEARNCSPSRYITVYYQLDGDGNWVKWDDIKQSGVIELFNPGAFRTREFNYAQLAFDFYTDDPTNSPVLEGWTMRFIMRPDTLLGFNFVIIAANELQSGMAQDERTAAELRDELLTVRNSKPPVLLVGLEGDEHWGYLTSFQGQPTYRIYRDEEIPDQLEYRFTCNFVEVG